MSEKLKANANAKHQLLIVDQDKGFLKTFRDTLAKKGYTVKTALEIKSAEKMLKESSIHVLLLTIDMDDSRAIEFIDQLRLISPRTLCIAMSDHRSTENAVVALQKGAYDFIKKPITDDALYSSLERCFDRIRLEKERASFEIALLEAEQRYRTLVETMKDGLMVMDQDRSIVYVNDSFCNITGHSKDELIEKYAMNFFDDENQLIFANKLDRLEKGKPESFEIMIRGKKGKVIPTIFSTQKILDAKGNFDGSFAVVTDITEHVLSKEKIQESEVKYRNLFEDSLDAIVITTRGGKFTDINRAAYELLGYSKSELMAISVQQIYENMDELLGFQQEIEEHGYVKEHKARIRKKDGTLMDCIITANAHRDKRGRIIGYQAIVRDITEKKRLENQILQTQKMDSIGTLASGVAHDFNNLLMGMRGKASLMLFKIDASHPHYEKLKVIEQLIDSATGLTKQLLDFARGGKFEMKTANINEIIHQSTMMFGRTKKAINIHKNCQEDAWTVNVDRGQIEQVLLNIYVNAAQAMPNGGDIYITSENVILDELFVRPHQIKPGRYVKVSIQDTGIGMDDKVIQKIFDPFFTTKKAEKGSGLGLSTAYGIIKKHGGIIDATSEIGKGSTFDIYFKVSERHLKSEEMIHQSVLPGSETVLVVDDEEVIVDHIKEMLETLGYTVETVLKGKHAVDRYKNLCDKIGIVILDMVMPEMSGSEVYHELKKINPDVKVLLASGYTADDKAFEILENKNCGFIQKPFDIVHLSHKLREVIESTGK